MLADWVAGTYTRDGSRLPAATASDGRAAVSADERLGDVGALDGRRTVPFGSECNCVDRRARSTVNS